MSTTKAYVDYAKEVIVSPVLKSPTKENIASNRMNGTMRTQISIFSAVGGACFISLTSDFPSGSAISYVI